MNDWLKANLSAMFAGFVTLVTVILETRRSTRHENNEAKTEQDKMQQYILKTVRDENANWQSRYSDLEDKYTTMGNEYDDFQDKHHQIVGRLQEQVALLTKENAGLREKNAALKQENAAYRNRYGTIKGDN
ncbi:MAG TPA: hypothetical protein H9875_00065 [Candidatus Levilactobacillus faecigallinarum]|uniref:Uncharacterized protein n=1 Tax=Candidatus Levilactobacillus faecigallinarum TaxID=2838638 RepID=A0A9D1QQA8_9LACO|nr:hypothetical protein [Candidatus Levilactobacillus faecigallinarum]